MKMLEDGQARTLHNIASSKFGEEFSSNFVSFSDFEKSLEEKEQTKVYDHVRTLSRGQKISPNHFPLFEIRIPPLTMLTLLTPLTTLTS